MTCAVVLVSLAAAGFVSRTAPIEPQLSIDAQSPDDVYRALVDSGARGRTVVLLDRSARLSGSLYLTSYLDEVDGTGSATVGSRNLVSALAAAGIAREAVVVLPPGEWAGFLEFARSGAGPRPVTGGYRTRDLGAGVTYTEPESVAKVLGSGERVILIVSDEVAGEYPAQLLDRLMSPESADIVVTQHGD